MPFDPTEVRSRDELLMGAIATGDSTVIGDPRDRNEEFIKAIADGISGAGKTIYRHNVLVRYKPDNVNFIIVYEVMNHMEDKILTATDLVSNYTNIIGYYISQSGYGLTYPLVIISGLSKVGNSDIKPKIQLLEQDPDTKNIFSSTRNPAIDAVLSDTVVEV